MNFTTLAVIFLMMFFWVKVGLGFFAVIPTLIIYAVGYFMYHLFRAVILDKNKPLPDEPE